MTPRIYSNIAVQTSLVSGITAAATSLTVADATGYPAAPFAIVVDPGSSIYEEVMLVTAKAGAVFTVTRAYDGTTAKVHAAGALVIHAAIADDFRGMQLGTRDVSSVAPGASDILTWNNGLAQWEPGAAPASGVTAVTATAPLQSSGGVTPDISFVNQAANLVLAGPAAGVAAAPTFRALVAADLPAHSAALITSGTLDAARGGTGVSNAGTLTNASNTTITGGGTLALAGFTLTVPATGAAALLDISNLFTARQDIRASGSGLASGLYVPWITGDTEPSLYAGSTSTSNSAEAIKAFSGTGNAVLAQVNATGGLPLLAQMVDTATTGVTNLVTFSRRTSGTPAATFGGAFSFTLKSSTTNGVNAGQVAISWSDPTHATRKARLTFSVYDTAIREVLRGEASGSAAMLGFLGASAIIRQAVAADASDLATAITLVNDIKAKLSAAAGGFGLFT